MKRNLLTLSAAIAAISSLQAFDAGEAVKEVRAKQLRQRSAVVAPVKVLWAGKSVEGAENLLAKDGKCAKLVSGSMLALDVGEASLSGYAMIHVKSVKASGETPVLRLAYSNYPEANSLTRHGDFSEKGRGCYMGRDTEIPVLPANVFRHEEYRLARTGRYLAPMHQGQFRYALVLLDTKGAEVEIDAIEWYVGDFYDRQDFAGAFRSSDPALDRHWQIGAWTAQLATVNDVDAWRTIDGLLLPRKLEKGPEVGLNAVSEMGDDGEIYVETEATLNPVRQPSFGVALFAKDAENALLISVDESGTARMIRRLNGRDDVLREERFTGLMFAVGAPQRFTIKWTTSKEDLYMSKECRIEIRCGNGWPRHVFTCYHLPPGRKWGFWTPKNVWPLIERVELRDGAGKALYTDEFDGGDAALAKNWDYRRGFKCVVDGAKRDRLIWTGDLWWAERNLFYSVADQYGMRESIKLMAHAQTPEGYIHACPYPEIAKPRDGDYGMFASDEFAAWFVPVLHDYYLFTADKKTLGEVYPALVKLMDYLDAHTRADGIFEQRFETSKHAACSALQCGDFNHRCYMDILLYECRRGAAELAAAQGDAERAAKWKAGAAKTLAAIRKVYWSEKDGRFLDSIEDYHWKWNNPAQKMDKVSGRGWGMEANAAALAFGVATPDEAKRLAPTIQYNPWVIKFMVMASRGKAAYGMADDAWASLSTNQWGALVKRDWNGAMTTTEGMNLCREGCGDQSHPDTALAGFISTAFLGVEPVEPGFAVFRFEPHPYSTLKWAEGRVPTPHGPIDARWERQPDGTLKYEFTVPKGTKCRLGGKEYDGPGSHVINR